jgi:prepilin-type N-terminal cleavage/methylation domain-containing protein
MKNQQIFNSNHETNHEKVKLFLFETRLRLKPGFNLRSLLNSPKPRQTLSERSESNGFSPPISYSPYGEPTPNPVSSSSITYNLPLRQSSGSSTSTNYSKAFTLLRPRLRRIKVASPAFTIVELIVTIVIIGILASIVIVSYIGISNNAVNESIKMDLADASSHLKLYYYDTGAYPTAFDSNNCPVGSTSTIYCLKTSPGNTFGLYEPAAGDSPQTYSLIAVHNKTRYRITNSTSPTDITDEPITLTLIAGTGGTATQSGTSPYNLNDTPTITATANTGYTFTSWTGSTGCSGIAAHTITMNSAKSCTANFISDAYTLTYIAGTGGSITGTTPQTVNLGASGTAVTAIPATYYSFVNWSDSVATAARTDTNVTANKSVTANFIATAISAPATPTVTPTTVGATTTYSWGAATCAGNTARYQYRYTINSATPYDSGLIATAATSVDFTTSNENLTYTVAVQAQCYNTATTSGWSTVGSGSYYRPNTYTLTLTAGTGGTVSQSGTSPYAAGATPTITATASSGYTFNSWTGTNCTGVASHAIPAIAANMSCTASFTLKFAATGGSITNSGGYTIHTFYSSGTFTPNMTGSVEYLVVAGGGGGGGQYGGGGGGGGYLTGTNTVSASAYSITVGGGGTSALTGTNGGNSVFGSATAIGGGAGGTAAGLVGGSGGGSSNSLAAVPGTAGQGNAGGTGPGGHAGGGGGAGAAGGAALAGGARGGSGISSSISGSSVCYAGGGGGIADPAAIGTATCGGGNGGYGSVGSSGTSNTGGGAGGTSLSTYSGYGGSGIVIIRYPT